MQFCFQGRQKGIEQIDQHAALGLEAVAEVILHQCAENDGAFILLRCSVVDLPERLINLVNGIQKWQSHLIKLVPFELCQQAVAQRFRGHAGLVGDKKYGATNHRIIYTGISSQARHLVEQEFARPLIQSFIFG